MVVLDAHVRDIIGSFYPSRPILTNAEIYRKILDINPEFSIYRLYLRYKRWNENKKEETKLYIGLKNFRFYATCTRYGDDIVIYAPLGYNSDGILELISSDNGYELQYFDTVDDEMQIIISKGYMLYEEIYNALVSYINNDISNPLHVKPYVTTIYHMQYSHVVEPPGDADMSDDEIDSYVNAIQELDSKFSLSRLYYIIHKQYTLSKKLDPSLIPIIADYLPEITHITYNFYNMDKTIILWNGEEELYNIDNANRDMFLEIIANLYHGINTSELELNINGIIEMDTYYETEGFRN